MARRFSQIEVEDRVGAILVDVLDCTPANISPTSSLIDDLEAQSIDFLDIEFRIKDEFQIELSEGEIWAGSLDFADPRWMSDGQVTSEGLLQLGRLMPDYPWERFGGSIAKADLPRLITVESLVRAVTSLLASKE